MNRFGSLFEYRGSMKNPLSLKNLSVGRFFAESKKFSAYLVYAIIFASLSVSLTSCKKEIMFATPETQLPGENYQVSQEQVKALDWQIVERWDYDNASRRLWKLRGISKNGEPTNYFILFTEVPDTIYWKPGYQKLDILNGVDLSYLIESYSTPSTDEK